MKEFIELFRLTTILLGKMAYSFSAIMCVYLITEAYKKRR
jgi:hypothetical protein